MAKQTQDLTILSAKSLTSDFNAPALIMSQWDRASIQATYDFSGGATSAGTIKLQVSNDGTNFADYANTAIAVTNASTVDFWSLADLQEKHIRVAWDNTSGTGGTVTIVGHLVAITE